MNTDWPMFCLSAAQTVFVVISLLLVKRQIRQASEASTTEAERAQNETLISYFSTACDRFYPHLTYLEQKFGVEEVGRPATEEILKTIAESEELRERINHMLGFLETMATGVNEKVFDFQLADKLLGGAMMRAWVFLYPLIRDYRIERNMPRFFDQAEILFNKLRVVHNYRPDAAGNPFRGPDVSAPVLVPAMEQVPL